MRIVSRGKSRQQHKAIGQETPTNIFSTGRIQSYEVNLEIGSRNLKPEREGVGVGIFWVWM
jgi:hypothetical protein